MAEPKFVPYTGKLKDTEEVAPAVSEPNFVPYTGKITESDVAPENTYTPTPEPEGINSQMYAGIKTIEEARAKYDELAKRPDAVQDPVFGLRIGNTRVPYPNPTLLGALADGYEKVTGSKIPFDDSIDRAEVNFITSGEGFATNAVGNMVETGAAIADKAIEKVGKYTGLVDENAPAPTDLAGAVEGAIPRMKAEGVVDNLRDTAAGLVIGGGSGTAIAKGVTASIPILRNSANLSKLAKVIGFETGAASAVNLNSETLAIGDKAMVPDAIQDFFPLLKGVDVSNPSSRADEVLAKRTNILMDAALFATSIETTLQGAAWAGKFMAGATFGPLIGAVSKDSQEATLFRELTDQVINVEAISDPIARSEAVKALGQRIADNKEIVIKMSQIPDGEIKIGLDTMGALEKSLEGNNTAEARQMVARLRGVRAGGMNKNAPQLAAKMEEGTIKTLGALDDTEAALGGSAAIDQSAKGFQAAGRAEYGEAQAAVRDADQAIITRETDIGELLRNDPTFGERMRRVGVDIDPYAAKDMAADTISTRVLGALNRMDSELMSRVGDIPQGSSFDIPGFGEAIRETAQNLNVLDDSGTNAMGNQLLRRISNAFTPRNVGTDAAGNAVQETAEQVTQRIAESGADFNTLYLRVRPELSKWAQDLYGQQKGEAGSKVRDLISHIDEHQMEWLAQNGDEGTVQAATRFMDYYRNDYAPAWRDGVLEQVANISRKATRGDRVLKPVTMRQEMLDLIGGNISNGKRVYTAQIADMLAREEGGGTAQPIADFMLGDVGAVLSTKLSNGARLTEIDVSDITGAIQDKMSVLRGHPVEQARLESLMNNINRSKDDVARLQTYADEIKVAADSARDRIFSDELGAFFGQNGVQTKGRPNGYKIFADVINGQQSEDVIRGLVQKANESGNPILLDGMKAAYVRTLKAKSFGTSESTAGVRQGNGKVQVNVADGTSNIMEYGKVIFQDQPEIMDAMQAALEHVGAVSRSKNAKPTNSSPTAYYARAKNAIDTLITNTTGVMSTVGARVRKGATNILTKISPDDAAGRVMDQLLADPDYFLEVLKKVDSKDTPMDEESTKMLFAFLVRGGVYNEEDEESFTSYMLNGAANAELKGGRMINSITESLGSETEKAFAK